MAGARDRKRADQGHFSAGPSDTMLGLPLRTQG